MKVIRFFAGLFAIAYLPFALPFLIANQIANPRPRPPAVAPAPPRPNVHVRYTYVVNPPATELRCALPTTGNQGTSAQRLPGY